MVSLGILLRFALLSTFQHGLPRYVIELFPLVAVLGGVALAGVFERVPRRRELRSES